MTSIQRHDRTKDNRARLPAPAIRNIACPDRGQRRHAPARAAAGETPLRQCRGRWGMPVPEPQGRTHALAKAGPEETHPAQTRRRKSPVTVESTKWRQELPWTEVPWRPPQNHFVTEPSFSKSFSQGSSWRHLPKTPNRSFCLCFLSKMHFPKKYPTKIILALEVP